MVNGGTDNTGVINFDLTPGHCIIATDFTGYYWGNSPQIEGMVDVPVPAGQETRVIMALGLLKIGLTDANGQPLVNQYVCVFTQQQDVSGNWVIKEEVANDATDNTGKIWFSLTPGKYVLDVNEQKLIGILLESGKITFTNGSSYEVYP